MSSVTIRTLTKRFGTVTALKGVDLDIKDREFLAIVGPSGCGKSSMLRLISGLDRPSSGRIFFDDEDVTLLGAEKRDVAMVFQSYALYPHKSVRKNLTFPLENMGLKTDEIDRRVERVARNLDIAPLLDRRPRQLSGGQRQRVALGRAVIRDAEVFLFDEPLSNLDAKLRVTMRSELKRLHDELRKTFIYVTHDQSEAMTMADRIVVMSNGEIQQIGTPDEIYLHPRNVFVAEFIGTPTMNMISGALENAAAGKVFRCSDGTALSLDDRGVTGDGDPDVALLGVRPEDVRVGEPDHAASSGVIEQVEPLHPDIFLIIRLGEAKLVAKVDASSRLRKGDRVGVHFRSRSIHFFGKDGGRLSLPPGAEATRSGQPE